MEAPPSFPRLGVPLPSAALTQPEGGLRVERAFAFLDLCGFTDFVDSHGDREAVVELRALRSAVREVAPLCGVRVDKWLGDGVMLVSPETDRVIDAVVGIKERFRRGSRLELRAGIAAGPVILLEGDDYVGSAVNLAARLCDLASPGQILAGASDLVVPEGVAVQASLSVEVRGMSGEVEVLDLTGERAGVSQTLRSIVGDLTNPIRRLR